MNLRDLAEKVKGFIQQNPTPMGFAGKQIQQRVVQPTMQRINTAIPGGVQGGIQRVKQGNNYNFYQQAAQGNVPTFQPFKPVSQFVGNYVQNRYVQPVLDLPKNVQALGNKNLDWKQRGLAGLGALGGVATFLPDPIQDAIMPVTDYFKGARASAIRGGNIKQNVQSGLQAMSWEKPVGLGTAMTTNPVGETLGNLAELPLSIGLTARMGKGQNLGFDKKTVEMARQGFTPQVKSMIKEFATQVETASDANKKNMGQLGDYIHTLAGAIWGDKNTANLTNKQLKNAFDILLQQVDNRAPMGRFYPIGLTMRDMREGIAPSTGGEINPLIQEAKKYKSAEEFVDKIKIRNDNFRNIDPDEASIGMLKVKDIKSSWDADTYSSLKDVPRKNNIELINEYKSTVKKVEKSPIGRKIEKPILVKKNIDGGEGYRIYDGNNRYLQAIKNGDEYIPAVFLDKSGGEKISSFWNKAQGSGGEITTLYHATPNKFDKFDLNRMEGGVAWFTDNPAEIKNNTVGAVQGAGQKLNVMTRTASKDMKWATPEMQDKYYTDQLIQMGYDGVKMESPNGKGNWYKVFDPNGKLSSGGEITKLNTVNPTGSVFSKYNAKERATMPLDKNITTLAETSGKSPDEIITIYRGVKGKYNDINAGDFITTNQQLAKDYAGTGKVLSKKVRIGDILDDVTEPLGEEYIYRPSSGGEIGKGGIEEANQLVRDALISGDEAGAKALYKDLSIDSKLNPFEQLKSEVSQMMKQELKSAESIQSSNYGEYEPLVKRMRSFLGMAGEKKSKETGELFREHIPRKVFGVSSDEVSSALGKTESEFMAEITNDLNMMGNATTRPQAIASFRQKVTRLKSIEDKLDPQFFKVIKSWDDKLQAVSVEPNPAFIKIRDEKARMKAARQEFEEWQRSYRQQTLPATPNTQASGVATQIKNATKSPVSKNPEQLKDISGWKAYMRDVYRNFKDVYGSRYEEVKRVILDPFDASKGRYVDMTEQWAKKLKTEIVDRLGIGKKSKESAAVQMYGEGKITTEELYKRFGEKKAQNIIEADKWFRQAYNELIDTVNATRKRIYPNNPEKWVAKRTDYYRHFREMKEGIGALFNIFDTPSNISSNLAGVSPVTKPKSKFLSIAQKREGDMSDLDAVGGFIDYIKQAAYATNIDPHIEQFRALSKELADTTGESKNLNTFIGYLENFANDLAGKTNPADRFIQEIIPGGRMTFRAINWLNNRVKANAVIGNVSSALSQIMNVPQGIADAGPINAVKGFGRTLAGIFAKDPAISKSTFVRERISDPFGQFDTGMIKDAKKFAVWMTGILDKVGTKIIWNSQYEKALAKKLPNAVKFADDATRSLVAGRGIGEVPLLQKARTMQMIAPFQLEVENLWWVMKDWVDEKSFGKLATFFVVNHVMNQAISQIRGSDVTFDPIQSMMDGYNSFKNEDDKKKGALMFAGRQLGEVASNVPFGQTIASLYPEYGLQVGDSTLPTRKDFFGKGNPVRTGSGILAAEGLKDPLFKVIPPYGGSQIKKTIEGVTAFTKGQSEDKKGNIRFPIEQNVPNAIKSTLFGQYATPEAREYFDKNRRALGEKQTALYKIASDKKAEYEAIMTKRAETALIDKAKEKMKAGNDKIQEVGTKVLIMQDNGDIATIDPSWMPEAPEMTGMAELDKKAISKFNSQITQKVNDIYELYKAGKLTEAEANDQIVQIKGLKLAGSKKAKAKKVTFKKTPYKTIKMSLPSASKVQNIKIAKAPKPKTAKSKAIKIANIKPIKVNKIKGLMVGTKLV